MKRLLLLLPLVALAACSSTLSETECLALDETRTKLLLRSRESAEAAADVENPIRVARNKPCSGMLSTHTLEEWNACKLELTKTVKVLTTSEELSELAGKKKVADLVITTPAAQYLVEEARSLRGKAGEASARMEKGNCLL